MQTGTNLLSYVSSLGL